MVFSDTVSSRWKRYIDDTFIACQTNTDVLKKTDCFLKVIITTQKSIAYAVSDIIMIPLSTIKS